MSQVNLNEEELIVLRAVLQSYLSDMRVEIADTDNFDFRQELKQKEKLLNSVVEKLG